MASLAVKKRELKQILNNGTSTSGTVRTASVKLSDIVTKSTLSSEEIAQLVNIGNAMRELFSLSTYEVTLSTVERLYE